MLLLDQLQHGAGNAWEFANVWRFVLVQALAFGPLLWWSAVGLRVVAVPQRGLIAFFAIPFAVLAYLSGGGTSLPHWTAPAWVALAPYAGVGLAAAWQTGRKRVWVASLAMVQALAGFAPGTPLTEARLTQYQDRLQKTRLFNSVTALSMTVVSSATSALS